MRYKLLHSLIFGFGFQGPEILDFIACDEVKRFVGSLKLSEF
jgi:hypothetical protein